MTPEEHYQHGVDLLARAEEHPSDDPSGAHVLAAIAQGHFTAAAAGSGLRAMELVTRPLKAARPDVGDTVSYVMPALGPGTVPKRHTGTVVGVGTDGFLTVEVPVDGPSPMTVIAPAESFTLVRTVRDGGSGG